jgi:hypothetical protein
MRCKLALLAFGVCLAGLLSGCGSSSESGILPLSVTTPSRLSQGVIAAPYNTTLGATGGVVPYAWNVASGNLPPGLSLSRAGVLSGAPTVSGGFSFTVAVTDSQQPPSLANGNFSISIAAAVQVTTTSLPNGSPSVFYNAALAASGGLPPYSWTITQGSLPNGLSLNATSGLISGTPGGAGTSTFTVQASDSETPAATATASLNIVINPPPPRAAALYVDNQGGYGGPQWQQTGLQIQSDGSLTLLPSSPESAINGSDFAPSPTLPLLFLLTNGTGYLESLLLAPDYSLALYSSSDPLPGGPNGFQPPSVDPTGSNLYLPGPISSSGATGVTIFPANGSLQPVGTITIPNIPTGNNHARMVFTPNGALAFIPTCSPSNQGSILSYSRNSDGTLTAAATYNAPSCAVVGAMTVSPDGKYLATEEVQIYTIGSDGTLTTVLPQPFTVTLDPQGDKTSITDMTWDQSSSFLLVSTAGGEVFFEGGVAVLSFSGSTLTETAYPIPGATGRIQQIGSSVYAMQECDHLGCVGPFGIVGFDFQNGQLTPLPGSPYQYGNGGDIVIY